MRKYMQVISILIIAVTSFIFGMALNPNLHPQEILVQDNFDGAITNWYSSGDNGGRIAQDTTFYMSPNSSMKILTPVGNNKWFYAERGISRPSEKRLGLEFWWQINSFTKNFEFRINWYHFENGTVHRYFASLIYDVPRTCWKYLDSDGYYHDIPNGTQNVPIADTAVWIYAKLVVDFESGKYVRFYSGDKTFDLSNLRFPSVAAFGNERIDWRFSLTNSDNSYSATANIDNVKVSYESS
jgi:hypothetical protein